MVDQETYWPTRKKTIASNNVTQSSTLSMISHLCLSNVNVVTRIITFTNKTLDGYNEDIRCQLVQHFENLPEQGDEKANPC